MKKIINWLKCEWEIFCFSDSAESCANSKRYTDDKIKIIKNKYKL